MLKVFEGSNKEVEVKFWKFPAGETGVKLQGICGNHVRIILFFESNDDLINLMFLCDAIREQEGSHVKIYLLIPYFPYARQDRYCAEGESFSLRVVCNLISALNFERIYVDDIHSEVMKGFFPAGTIDNSSQVELQDYLVTEIIGSSLGIKAIVAPDNGAVKKASAAAKTHDLDLIEFSKQRDPKDGSIKSIKCNIDKDDLNKYSSLIVVDDICDGGYTFIQLAQVIKEEYGFTGDLHLVVTHGIFSKGFDDLNKYYTSINWVNSVGNKELNNERN